MDNINENNNHLKWNDPVPLGYSYLDIHTAGNMQS